MNLIINTILVSSITSLSVIYFYNSRLDKIYSDTEIIEERLAPLKREYDNCRFQLEGAKITNQECFLTIAIRPIKNTGDLK